MDSLSVGILGSAIAEQFVVVTESNSLDEYWEKLQVWSDKHVVGGRNSLPEYVNR